MGFPSATRTTPHLPQGGRSTVASAFANHQCQNGVETSKMPISPLEGEMPGRAEGGASR
ncbi:propionyl-coenzyme A carboxylase alpha polypeptide [Mesorhizobium sp. B2-3-5]|nr:propionyl-coenzyme A carboxylase alpha polypeptide [Mesorhizobium sp. B2-3-5]